MSGDLECFNAAPSKPDENPLICAFFFHDRNDGWEKVMFHGSKPCIRCGNSDWFGWIEMESDVIRCNKCLPPEKKEMACR